MAKEPDYRIEGIVLKWVKLKESDAIVKMVAPDGSLVEGVAKGIRKPKNSTSSKLEPFSHVEAFIVRGKSLDIIKDCRLLHSNEMIREDPCRFACASCLGELLCKTVQKDIEVPNAFGLTLAYLEALGTCDGAKRLCLTSAALLKACAYLGFMPSLGRCVACGEEVDVFDGTSFSFPEGGIICKDCSAHAALSPADASTVSWARAFLHMRFSDICTLGIDDGVGEHTMRFANTWIRTQTGVSLKSYPLALQICSI